MDPEQRFEALQQKLVSYANYVADGQYLEQAPGIAAERVAIRVVCQTEPTGRMLSLVSFRASDFGVRVADIPVAVETRERRGDQAKSGAP